MNSLYIKKQLILEKKPLYIIKGSDAYYRQHALNSFKELVDNFVSDLNINYFQYNATVEEVIDALNIPAFMSDTRLVVWFGDSKKANIELAKYNAKELGKYLKQPNPNSVLVLFDEIDYFTLCYKLGEIVDCGKLETSQLMKIVSEKIENQGYTTDNVLIKEIIQRSDNDMDTINNELTKAFAFALDTKIIDNEVINESLIADIEQEIFRLSDFIVHGKVSETYKLLDILLMRGEEPLSLLSLITAHFRRMFLGKVSKLSNDALGQLIGCKPYSIKIARDSAVSFKPMQIKKILDALQNIEFDCKQGKLAIDDGLQKAICIGLSHKL